MKVGGISLAGMSANNISPRALPNNSFMQAMDSMIAAAKKSEEDYDRFHGATDRSGWDGCGGGQSYVRNDLLTPHFFLRRAVVLKHRSKLAAEAARRKLADPSKVILNAIPSYQTASSSVDIEKLIKRAEKLDISTPKHELDEGDEDSTRISIVDVLRNVRQNRQRELDRVPAVFIDD